MGVCVCVGIFIGIVKDAERAIATLGGIDALSKVRMCDAVSAK